MEFRQIWSHCWHKRQKQKRSEMNEWIFFNPPPPRQCYIVLSPLSLNSFFSLSVSILREIDKKILFESIGDAFTKLGHNFYFPILVGQFRTGPINAKILSHFNCFKLTLFLIIELKLSLELTILISHKISC